MTKLFLFRLISLRVLLAISSLITALFITNCTEVVAPEDITPPAAPANFISLGANDGQVRLRWSPNTEIDFNFYRLYRSINNDSTFSILVQLTQTEYLDRFLYYDSTYYYYSTAVDKAGNESGQSLMVSGVQPLNTSNPQSPTFFIASGMYNPSQSILEIRLSWTPPDISDLLRYKIYRSVDSIFVANPVTLIDSTNIAIYSDRFPSLNTKYFYKVTAVDRGFKESQPSKISSDLILSSPQLISPANQIRFTTPYIFDWDPVEKAVAYIVYVARGPFSDVIWNSPKTVNTEILYNGPALASSQIYYWWVGAYSKAKIKLENGVELPAPVNSYSTVNSFFSE